jgi:hypothetical protein
LGVVSIELQKICNQTPSESTNAILIVTNQGSLFTFEAMMNFDKMRELTEADVLLNRSSFYFLIKTNGGLQSIMRLLEVMHTSSKKILIETNQTRYYY